MKNRVEIEKEIFEMIDNEIVDSHQLLIDFISAMSTQELSESWDYIKRCYDLDAILNEEEVQ